MAADCWMLAEGHNSEMLKARHSKAFYIENMHRPLAHSQDCDAFRPGFCPLRPFGPSVGLVLEHHKARHSLAWPRAS